MPYRQVTADSAAPDELDLEDVLAAACGFPLEVRRTVGERTAELRVYSPVQRRDRVEIEGSRAQAFIALVGADLEVRLAPPHAFCTAMRALRIEVGHVCRRAPPARTHVWKHDVGPSFAEAIFASIPQAFEPDHHSAMPDGATVRGFFSEAGGVPRSFESVGALPERQAAFAFRLVGLARNLVGAPELVEWANDFRPRKP